MSAPAPTPPSDPSETAREALDWAVAHGSGAEVIALVARRHRQRVRRRWWLATGVAASVLLALTFLRPGPTLAPVVSAPLPAAVAIFAPETRTLPDGSIVELRPGADLAVEFTASTRRILLRRGEAHFAVVKDPARPFVVASSAVEVVAIGTAFSVDLSAHSVAVLVTHGRVAVSAPAADPAAAPSPVLVEAGSGTRVDFAPAVPARIASAAEIPAHERDERLAWRIPRLQFSGTRLADALPLFNRHSSAPLALDPALGNLKLSGTLRADDTDSLLLLLRNEFGIEARPAADGTLRLRRP